MYTPNPITKSASGANDGNGSLTWTVPENMDGMLTYTITNGHDHWDYADDTYGGDVSMTITCETPSGTLVKGGNVIKFKWKYHWYKGSGVWNCSAKATVQITLLYSSK